MQDLRQHIEVMSEIKRRLSKVPAKVINLTISGSKLYGFDSSDSDIDYRGTFQVHSAKLLGLSKPKSVLNFQHGEDDVCLFELEKEINLALSGNCNVLEHIFAPQIFKSAEFISLRTLINNSFGKVGIYNSYKGMATQNYKKFILQGKNTVKKYLYVFRSLMAGIYVLQTGCIQPNLEALNSYFKIPEVKELIKIKQGNLENGLVPPNLDTGALETKINELFDKIDKAYEKSQIPDYPTDEEKEEINNFLVKVRKSYIN